MSLSEHVVSVDGLNVRYYEAGPQNRLIVLMLHGHLGDAWLHWAGVMPHMADNYRLIAPDLPGFGQSDPLPTTTLPALVDWVRRFTDVLEATHYIIIGNSFGGLIARLLAAEEPDRVDGLILVNGGVIPAVPGCARQMARTPGVGGLLFNRIARSTVSRSSLDGLFEDKSRLTDEIVERVQANQPGTARLMRALSLSETPKRRTPKMPVLLLWGDEDAITPRVVGEQIRDRLPDARMELITGARHVPHIEEPDIFIWQADKFIIKLARPGDVDLL